MSGATSRAERNGSDSREYAVVMSARALAALAVAVVATIVAMAVVDRATTVFTLLGAAITAAMVGAPAVRALGRHMKEGLAVALLAIVGMAGVVAILTVVARDLDHQEAALRSALHQSIADLPADSTAAEVADDLDVDERIDEVLDGAATRFVIGADDPVAIAGQVGEVVVVGVLAAFMVAGGRRIVHAAIRFIRRASIREEVNETLIAATARAGAFLRRTLVVSTVHGIVAAAVVRILDLPGPIAMGAWVALTSTIPILGGIAAWFPIVVLGWVNDVSLWLTIGLAVAFIVGDRVARARWVHRVLRVGPLLSLLGITAGLSMIGVAGALLGLFGIAFAAAVAAHRGHIAAAVSDLVQDPADRQLPNAVDDTVATSDDPHDVVAGRASGASNGQDDGPETAVVGERRRGERIVRLRISTRTLVSTAAVAVAGVALFDMLGAVQPMILWFAVAGFIAAGLDRPISAMFRRGIPRAIGTTLMLGAALGAVVAVFAIGGRSITNSTETIAREAPETVRSMESLPIVGKVLERNGAADKVEEFLRTLPDRLRESDAIERVISAAGNGAVTAFWIVALMLAILWDGPRLVTAVRQRIPVVHRRRAIRFGRAAYTAVSNVVAAAAFVAALNGTVVMSLAVALGIPLAPLLGIWAAFWNFIPQIGGFIGAAPLVALGFARGPWQGVIALGVFIVYQTFENHVIQPLVGSRAVRLPPLIVMVGALFGGALAGFVGALMAGPTLGVAKIAVDEFRHDRRRIEDRQDRAPAAAVTQPA